MLLFVAWPCSHGVKALKTLGRPVEVGMQVSLVTDSS